MWAMRLNIVDWGCFKIQILREILKTQNQHQEEFCELWEVEHLYRLVGCARSKRQYLTAPRNQRSYRWMLVWVWTVYLRSTCGIQSSKCCDRITEYQDKPKIKQVLDKNVDLSNVDQVPSNAHLSEKESQLYNFEDNEAVIKMIIKGRSPTMRHVSRTHRVALDLLFDRINLDPIIQIKYVESKNQLADILTKRQFHTWWVVQFVASF